MLAAVRFWLSPSRRRFMRSYGRPAMRNMLVRLQSASVPSASGFITTIIRANAEYLAYALAPGGPIASYAANATPASVEACLAAMMVFAVNLFARDAMARENSGLIAILAAVAGVDPIKVMVQRNNLRKAPHSEEWMLYTWMVAAMGGGRPSYDADLERHFGFNYLSYIAQYRPALEREAARLGA